MNGQRAPMAKAREAMATAKAPLTGSTATMDQVMRYLLQGRSVRAADEHTGSFDRDVGEVRPVVPQHIAEPQPAFIHRHVKGSPMSTAEHGGHCHATPAFRSAAESL